MCRISSGTSTTLKELPGSIGGDPCGQSITSSTNYSGGQNGWRKLRFFFQASELELPGWGLGMEGSPGGWEEEEHMVRGRTYI